MSGTLSIDKQSFLGIYAAFGATAQSSTAVSYEAKAVAQDTKKIDSAVEHSESLFGAKADAISELRAIAEECGEEGWDGEGASAVEPWAVYNAERFIRVFPGECPMPEITPEPDGCVGLDWSVGRSRVFSVSFGSSPRLAYAWLDGTDRGHAVARFDGETIPRRILDGIRELTGVW